jgi:hypothetical protein
MSQTAYLERLVAESAATQWENDFWSQMSAAPYGGDDRADLAEQEAAYDADFEADK